MKLIVFFLLLKYFCIFGLENKEEYLIDYYENLIETEISKAMDFELPTNGDEFKPKDRFQIEDFGDFDFIVVGSGSGGSVLANRLSEIQDWNILLIEAGGPETNFSVIPGMHVYLQGSRFNWNYESTSQTKACLGMKNHRCTMPRGKCLGGSSSINGLVYSRGHKYDYDRWAQEGNPGWSYDDVLPYFIKSENSQINGDPGFHGRNGYWNVKYHRPNSEQATAYVTGSKIAYPSSSHDYNGREELGAFYSQLSNIKQFRHSTSKAFLEPVMNRPNLKILINSYVTKVVLNSLTKTAVGVWFTRNGTTYFARARKEVIVSGGAINSPQILMLSGIGPRDHLHKMKIPVIHNLPSVGRNLYNHAVFFGGYISTNLTEPEITLRENIKNFLNDYGTLTIALNSQAVSFYQSKLEKIPNYPDIEVEVNPAGGPSNFIQHSFRFQDEVFDALFKNMNMQTTMNTYVVVLRNRSFGKLTLRSNDPFEYPDIDSNLLDNDEDVEIMYEGIEILKKIIETEPMQKINASLVLADYPQCRGYEMGSKDYWVCVLRLMTGSLYHESSTCRMGRSHNSVVDSRARVHGIKRLRVVDASVIPFPLSGHTSAPTVMIAEKVSDYIKDDHRLDISQIPNKRNRNAYKK